MKLFPVNSTELMVNDSCQRDSDYLPEDGKKCPLSTLITRASYKVKREKTRQKKKRNSVKFKLKEQSTEGCTFTTIDMPSTYGNRTTSENQMGRENCLMQN